MKWVLIACCLALAIAAPLPSRAQAPSSIVLSAGLVQEILYVLNASGTANGTVSRLQGEIQHQPQGPPPAQPGHGQPDAK